MVLGTVLGSSKLCFIHRLRESRADMLSLIYSLANAEMRLILTKVLWYFDLEPQPESLHWSEQRSYSLWSRPPLMVKLYRAGTK